MSPKRHYKRGFPVAILIGFDGTHAVLWQIFSQVVKPHVTLKLSPDRIGAKALYSMYESVIQAVNPLLREGVRTVVIAAPTRTNYAEQFMNHIRRHHTYLFQGETRNALTFAKLVGCATDFHGVLELAKTKAFNQMISKTTSEEASNIIGMLDRSLYRTDESSNPAIFALDEIEHVVYGRQGDLKLRSMILVLTDKYLAAKDRRSRLNRLMQVCKNKSVKTKVVNAESPAGIRIDQFGGIVLFKASPR